MLTTVQRPKTRTVVCWSIVLCTSLLVALGIALLASSMAPIREGNSGDFWSIATDVRLSPDVRDGWGDAYFVDDEWAAYVAKHLHGSDVYRVPVSEVFADFEEVKAELEQALQRGDDSAFVKGYAEWRELNDRPRDAQTFLSSIHRAERREWSEEGVDVLALDVADEQEFWERWRRADWYWGNIVFEWM